MKAKLLSIYLDWVNNYITTAKMADDYGVDDVKINRMISIGRRIYNGK
jgi:hypothetical protein